MQIKAQKLKRPSGHQFVLELGGGPVLPSVPRLLVDYAKKVLPEGTELEFSVAGRAAFDGLNEAVSDKFQNLNFYSFNTATGHFHC